MLHSNCKIYLLGLPETHLHMAIHGFVLEEDTKPVHERHTQVLPAPLQA
jgi:hypothetical protein